MTAKTSPKLRVASDNTEPSEAPAPDLAEMERVVTEAAKQQAPMVSRADTMRDELVVKANALVAERATYVDRMALLTRQFESAREGLNAQIADIDTAFALINGGIGETSPRREG